MLFRSILPQIKWYITISPSDLVPAVLDRIPAVNTTDGGSDMDVGRLVVCVTVSLYSCVGRAETVAS